MNRLLSTLQLAVQRHPKRLVGALGALLLGTGLAWAIITQLFEFDWLPDWPRILAVLGAGLVLVLTFAFAASLPVLRAKPAQTLRNL